MKQRKVSNRCIQLPIIDDKMAAALDYCKNVKFETFKEEPACQSTSS